MSRLMLPLALLLLSAASGFASDRWRGYGGYYPRTYRCFDVYGYPVPCYRPYYRPYYYAPPPRYYFAPRFRGYYAPPSRYRNYGGWRRFGR